MGVPVVVVVVVVVVMQGAAVVPLRGVLLTLQAALRPPVCVCGRGRAAAAVACCCCSGMLAETMACRQER